MSGLALKIENSVKKMQIVIFGNSGSGKTTLSKKLKKKYDLSCLDLDTVAWKNADVPARAPLETGILKIKNFTKGKSGWVIEGCYEDLLRNALIDSSEIIFLNPGLEICVKNARNRKWEPHKYHSIEDQNKNLNMLIQWIQSYYIRNDEFSYNSHRKLFEGFPGNKKEITAENYQRFFTEL